MAHKHTDEQLSEAIRTSRSIREALGKLGLVPAGGNYQTLHSAIKRLSIDVSHMTGQASNRGVRREPKRHIGEYLDNQRAISSSRLRLRIISAGLLEAKCNSCDGLTWLDKPIPLELDHIDGDRLNNQLTNLRLLCPNCHAFTSTYRGKNKRNKRLARDCQ